MKSTRKRSLEVRKKAKEALNEITTKQDWEFREDYNDLYGRKNGYEVRRLKGSFKWKWIHKEIWSKWKEEFEKKELLDRWVNGHEDQSYYYDNDSPSGPPQGTAEEYEDRFNNEDLFFIIRIIYKDELDAYCTKRGIRK